MVGNVILSVCIIIFSLFIFLQTSAFPEYKNLAVIGPEAIPNCLAGFMLLIAVLLLINEGIKAAKGKHNQPSYVEAEIAKAKETWQVVVSNKMGVVRVMGNLVLMVLFGVCLRTVGFEICGFVFLVCSMLLNGIRTVWKLIVIPLATIAVVYGVFVIALRINIPMLFL